MGRGRPARHLQCSLGHAPPRTQMHQNADHKCSTLTAAPLALFPHCLTDADLVFSREADADLYLTYLELWAPGAPDYPYSDTQDSGAALDELKAHWDAHRQVQWPCMLAFSC